MKWSSGRIIVLSMIFLFLCSGCEAILEPDQQAVQASVEAEVVEAVAMKTYDAAAQNTAEALKQTVAANRVTTETFTATVSATVTETQTPTAEQSGTPQGTLTATVIAGPGDRAELVSINVPPGTQVNAGTTFTVTWTLKNVGSNSWNSGYDVMFVSGENMGAPTSMKLADVQPGQSVQISMNMVMPPINGRYIGNWKLRNPDGEFLLIANTAANSLVVDVSQPLPPTAIYVPPTSTAIPTLTHTLTLIPTSTQLPTATPTMTATRTPTMTLTPYRSLTPTRTRAATSASASVPAPSLISPSGSISCTSTIRLTWSNVYPTNGLAYYIWYYEHSSGDSDEGSTFTNYYDISGIYCGETYSWRVQAVDKNGNVGPYSTTFQFTPN